MRGVEPLLTAWKAVVLAVEHHTRRVPPPRAGSTPGWDRTNDLPRIRRTLYRPSYGRQSRGTVAATKRVPRAGFEPATPRISPASSTPLSYLGRMETVGVEPTFLSLQSWRLTVWPRPPWKAVGSLDFSNSLLHSPGWSRTTDLRFRRPRPLRAGDRGGGSRTHVDQLVRLELGL